MRLSHSTAFFMALSMVLIAATSLTGCQRPEGLYADHAYVRMGPVKGRPSVAYVTLHGAAANTVLLSITSPAAIRSELHESMTQGGMASMVPIKSVPLPADGTVEFKPGGKHVMLFDINPSVQPGGSIPLLLTFANNQRIELNAPVIGAGDPAPNN